MGDFLKEKISFEDSLKIISFNFLILVLIFFFTFSLKSIRAFSEPTAPPPAANKPGPLNVGPSTQTKAGLLSILNELRAKKFSDQDDPVYYFDPATEIKINGTLDLNNNLIFNVAEPINPLDLATKGYVDKRAAASVF